MYSLRRYLTKVFLLSYHLLKNVAYSFRVGPVLRQLAVKTIEPILMDYTVDVSESILRDSLAHSVSDNTITDDIMDYVVSTTMDTLRQVPSLTLQREPTPSRSLRGVAP
jgi:hypothetical protein